MKLMFVCGCGHSGTSLIAAMFGAHSKIHAINYETQIFLKNLTSDQISEFFEDVARSADAGAEYLCEKTPSHVGRIAAIRASYPDAPIVVVVRDPRDVCASLKKRTNDLPAAIRRWNKANATIRARTESHGDLVVFRYEDLIEDPTGVVMEICLKSAVPFEAAMLEFHKDEREWFGVKERRRGTGENGVEHNALRNWQIHQPLTDNRGRWKSELSRAEVEEIETRSAKNMAYFGYAMSEASAAT